MMIIVASTAGTIPGQQPSPPVYYTQELCMDAARQLESVTGSGGHACVKVHPMVNMQMQGNVVYSNIH
jgi:hypothetical protein